MKHTDDVDDGRGDGVLAAARSVNERRLEQLRRTRVTGALDTAEVVALIHSIRDRKGVDRRRRRGARNRPAESRLSALVLDAGALVAVDRGDRSMMARLRVAQQQGIALRTSAIVIAQVWRDPAGRQARLARLLRALDVRPVDEQLGRDAGVLLARAGADDPIDAVVALIAAPGDRIMTSDPGDLSRLVASAGKRVAVVSC